MSPWVLDTDTLTLLERAHPLVSARVLAQPTGAVATAIISVEEQFSGWNAYIRRARRPDQLAYGYLRFTEVVTHLTRVPILTYTLGAIHRFDQLKSLRLNIGGNDLRIAAIALEHGATLVTRNRADFARVPGVTIADWSV